MADEINSGGSPSTKATPRPINETRIDRGLGGGNLQSVLQSNKPAQQGNQSTGSGTSVLNESTRTR